MIPHERLSVKWNLAGARRAPAGRSRQAGLPGGSVASQVLRIALPGMLAMLASSLCALLDALLLGQHNAAAAAAVSVGFPLLTMIQTIGFTLGMGAGSVVSRSLGAGDRAAACQASSCALGLALLLSAGLGIPALCLAGPLVRLLGADSALLPLAAAYARCVLASAPMLCANLVLTSLLRGQGLAMPNLIAFGVGALTGSALQFALIPRMGVLGSGLAMLAREAATLLALLLTLRRSPGLIRPRPIRLAQNLCALRPILRFGLPTLLRQGLMSASGVLLSRVAAGFGEAALAGIGLSVRALSLVTAAVIGFGQGFQPVCGFAAGSGHLDVAAQAYRLCMRCIVWGLAAAGALLFALAGALLTPFQPAPEVAAVAVRALRAQSVVLFAQGAVILMNMLTQALGMTVRASVVATSRQGFVLIPLLLLLPRRFGLTGLILCQSVSDVLSLGLCVLITRPALRRCACAPSGCSDARTASR